MIDEKPKRSVKLVPTEEFVTTEKKMAGESVPTEDSKTTILKHDEFTSEPAMVGIEHGVTLNLGNYESARVSVSIRMPSVPSQEALDVTYELAKAWVEKRVQEEIKGIRQFTKGVSGAKF